MNQVDPTDHVLAAIASIMDHPESTRENEAAAASEIQARVPVQVLTEPPAPPPSPTAVVEETPLAPSAPASLDADGYCKVGPGPMAAIRFKWSVRRDDEGRFFVDETIGDHSVPIVSGPMSSDDAIRMVDTREAEARQRFDQLRDEMTGRAAGAGLVRNDSGEM